MIWTWELTCDSQLQIKWGDETRRKFTPAFLIGPIGRDGWSIKGTKPTIEFSQGDKPRSDQVKITCQGNAGWVEKDLTKAFGYGISGATAASGPFVLKGLATGAWGGPYGAGSLALAYGAAGFTGGFLVGFSNKESEFAAKVSCSGTAFIRCERDAAGALKFVLTDTSGFCLQDEEHVGDLYGVMEDEPSFR